MWNSDRFLLYKVVPSKTRPGKMDKLPVSPHTFKVCSATDPAHFAPLDTCRALAAAGLADGVAWSVAWPYYFLDIDGALKDGEWQQVSHELVGMFPGAFCEISHSGKGLHVIGKYAGPEPLHACKRQDYRGVDLEFYTSGRFCALTFNGHGSPDVDGSLSVAWLVNNLFVPKDTAEAGDWTDSPCPEWDGPTDDDELIAMMLNAKGSAAAAFGSRASFRDLWEADPDKLAVFFPTATEGKHWDGNAADLAFCSHLAFWTGRDCERMWRLIQRSGLMRDKWERDDYRHNSITRAAHSTPSVYGANKAPEYSQMEPAEPIAPVVLSAPPVPSGAIQRDGFQFLGITQQLELFAGCVYIRDLHQVLIPSGEKLNSAQFKATYGGYIFALDATNTKVTRNAFEAFTESLQLKFPQASAACFRPQLAPGAIVYEEGLSLVNTYVPVPVPRKVGDPSPFIRHLQKLLPDERDQLILLSYMAACVQHVGIKFQWCPLIQGVEGNGKSLFTRCVARAVGRRYVHLPQAEDIGNKFNSWLIGKVFCGVEDIYVPESKTEIMEIIKPMITGEDQGTQGKGKDQGTSEVCCNFILNSNHKDAVKKTQNDRRFCIFYTVQQDVRHLQRDGMDGAYMQDLYHWLKAGEGYAVVSEFLHTWPIPEEYNPATRCHRAPDTSSTVAAIAQSMGGVEQEIAEAVAESRPGFAGGWVSSVALDRLLRSIKAERKYPQNKRRQLLESMGFIAHPALPDGRAQSVSMIDGGSKPRLFITPGHLALNLETPARVLAAYVEAQQQQQGGPFGQSASN